MEDFRKYQVRVKDLAEDTIEKKWIPLWSKIPMHELSDSESLLLIKLHLKSEEECKVFIEEDAKIPSTASGFIHNSMIPRFNIKMDFKTQLWLACIFDSPGTSVMIFAYIKWRMHELQIDELDFSTYCTRIFPSGMPNKEEFQWLWDCQKLTAKSMKEWSDAPHTGNLLDCAKCYKSFI